jgi:hypothetical protein
VSGSLSYQHPHTGEWAHHRQDPYQEALLCFVLPALELGLPPDGSPLNILEFGFGRGANTAVALEKLREKGFQGEVQCLGLEPNPSYLEPWPENPPSWGEWPWWAEPSSSWKVKERPWAGTISQNAAPEGLPKEPWADWIFLDLFSPAKHPSDWPSHLFSGLARAARPGAVLTSYCCARAVRDRLTGTGWEVERLSGDYQRDHLRARMPCYSSARA